MQLLSTTYFAKLSLSALWIVTGITSIVISPEIGREILGGSGIEGSKATILIYSGGILDILIGIWLLSSKYLRACYLVQIFTIVVYTCLLTLISPAFWLHPFGPITKNIPIVALLFILMKEAN